MEILEVHNVVKAYGNQLAVDNISFKIAAGEIVGFLGPNGAGKSTTMKMIAGILSPDQGEILIKGKTVSQNHPEIRHSLAYLPENNPLYPDLYIREYLEFMAEIHQIKSIRQSLDEVIKVCGLAADQHKKIGSLSKGFRQRVGLAQSILHQPDLFVLDEATTGLDPNQILEIRDLIKTLGKSHAVLISTHVLQEVESICNRCLVIHKGKLIADDPMTVLKNKLHPHREVLVSFDREIPLDLLLKKWTRVNRGPYEFSYLIQDEDTRLTQTVYRWVVENKLGLNELKWVENKMEDVFYSLTGNPVK
jgi:ABC-2 type transport system ATP-binding protein